jgi:4-hydroxybenzoate polyprenyltransferase
MCCYAIMLGILTWIGLHAEFKWPYFSGLAVSAALAGYHYTLIRSRERRRCFQAFLHNNWVGAAIFTGMVCNSLLK